MSIAMRRWDKERVFIDEIFRRYWEENDASVADYEGLRDVAAGLGVDPDVFEETCESDNVRQGLIDSTNTALDAGVFGAPSIIVNGELYWGKDRMEFVEDELTRMA